MRDHHLDDDWALHGGLWLPRFGLHQASRRQPTSRRYLPGNPCCGGNVPGECEECVNTPSVYNAPETMLVVMSGVSNASCSDCNFYNDSFELDQEVGSPCQYKFTYSSTCGATFMTLRFDSYKIEFFPMVGFAGWGYFAKSYGAKIDCLNLSNVDVPFVSQSSAPCDFSNATVTVSTGTLP